ncbi:hypothetical protein Gogos_021159, partial [Gossypium gossypioides]|nr:hypothetical protein [Gossypium gossypioides]
GCFIEYFVLVFGVKIVVKERNEVIHRNLASGKPTPCPPHVPRCHPGGGAVTICPPDCS